MKLSITIALTLFTSLAGAEVLDVDIWEPRMGGMPATLAAARQAQAIIEKAGGNAGIAVDRDGNLHFANYHDNWAEWAKHNASLAKDEDWTAFVAKWNSDPSAKLVENYLLNTPVSGGVDGDVYQVFIWEAVPGRAADMMQAGVQAKALHEKDGAAVSIHVDQMNRMHYVMSFADWDTWAKFQDADHSEFEAWMRKRQQDPTARLVKVYTASSP
jgi:hypothetical protein